MTCSKGNRTLYFSNWFRSKKWTYFVRFSDHIEKMAFRVASEPRVKLVSCKSALNPSVVYSTDRSKAVVPVLVLLFVALWLVLRGHLFYVLPCVILFCFPVLSALRLPRLGKRELILVLFVCLFDLRLFGFVCFLFLLVSGKARMVSSFANIWDFNKVVISRKHSYIMLTPFNPTFI